LCLHHHHVCDRCGDKEELCEDEDGFIICAECAKHIEETKIKAKLVQLKIQLKFGIPITSPYIGEIDDWVFEVVQYPSVPRRGDEGEGCCEWVSALTPLTHLEMTKFALLEPLPVLMARFHALTEAIAEAKVEAMFEK
jgi:hypothetical protein